MVRGSGDDHMHKHTACLVVAVLAAGGIYYHNGGKFEPLYLMSVCDNDSGLKRKVVTFMAAQLQKAQSFEPFKDPVGIGLVAGNNGNESFGVFVEVNFQNCLCRG
jgi:hypothetical protein